MSGVGEPGSLSPCGEPGAGLQKGRECAKGVRVIWGGPNQARASFGARTGRGYQAARPPNTLADRPPSRASWRLRVRRLFVQRRLGAADAPTPRFLGAQEGGPGKVSGGPPAGPGD